MQITRVLCFLVDVLVGFLVLVVDFFASVFLVLVVDFFASVFLVLVVDFFASVFVVLVVDFLSGFFVVFLVVLDTAKTFVNLENPHLN